MSENTIHKFSNFENFIIGLNMDHTIAKIKGLSVLLAADANSRTLIQETIHNKRWDVMKWLIDEELVYISEKTYCNGKGIFSLLKIKDNIPETLDYLNSLNYTIITYPLMHADMHRATSEPDVLYWLLQHGGNIEELNSNGCTLLHSAIAEKLFNVFYLLLEMGADINAQDLNGDTPLHLAVENNEEMTHCLIQHGCDIDAQNHDGHTSLCLAVDCNNEEVICMLLYYNADTEIGKKGRTPLIRSFRFVNDNNIISELLLEYAYDCNAPTSKELNALYYALTSNNPLDVEIIRRGGLLPKPSNRLVIYDLMYYAVRRKTMTLFKLAFGTYNIKRLRLWDFYRFIGNITFPTKEWIKYLYLILRSEFASEAFSLLKWVTTRSSSGLYARVLKAFVIRDVREEDRIEILKMLFERKIEIKLVEVAKIYAFYGFNGEFELLFKMPIGIISQHNICNASVILDFKSFASDRLKVILSKYLDFHLQSTGDESDSMMKGILELGTFISLRQHVEKFNDSLCETNNFNIKKLMKITNKMPIVPSLQELSRNAVRAAIGRKFPGKNPSFYQKYLEKLPTPSSIVDIIRLKVPIYKDFTPLLWSLNSEQLRIESEPDRFNNGIIFY